jgi:hypothetical protein
MRTPLDPLEALRTLVRHEVEFIVIGGLAATFQGAPVVTFDLDVVHRRTEENVERLLGALADLDAYYREHEDRRPTPEANWLLRAGHHLLNTRCGHLDLLGAVTEQRDYEALLPHTESFDIGEGLQARILTLEMLIQLKEELHRDKDRAVLPTLRHTLKQREALRRSSQE